MCGLAGILQPNPNTYLPRDLQRMTDALAHRGPDGMGHWQSTDGTVLLGHRRLKIIDLSEEAKQPFQYLHRYTIVHNGEIYNYLELKENLSLKGYVFRTKSDTEVIAAAYDHWGKACVSKFDGMFAFAIWDEKEQSLFAARDRFGEKPFYYTLQGQSLIFASEIKAFWALGINKEVDRHMAFHYLTLGYVDDPLEADRTFFHQIHKLPAAHTLKYSAIYRDAVIERFWDIDLQETAPDITDEEAQQRLMELLTTSVKRRLRCDVQMGCSLSGGVDSGTLAYLLSKQMNEPVQTFTAVFPGFDRNEWDTAQTIAKHIGARAQEVVLADTDWFRTGIECLKQQDEPVGSSSVFAQYAVHKAIQSTGVKVVIDGQGADEILGGYERYYPWYWQELYRSRKLRFSQELASTKALGAATAFNWKNKLAAFFPHTAAQYRKREYHQKANLHPELYKDFKKEHLNNFHHALPEHPGLNGALYFTTCTHGLEELLRYADRNAMGVGLEARFPFLAHELVEFIFSLPSQMKIRQGWRKWILRASMQNHLPAAIIWNTQKIGFETPQMHWMQQPSFQEAIHDSKKILIEQKMLAPSATSIPIRPTSAHAPDPYDWRYFSLSQLFD